jgi:hypothetical protein
MVASVKSKRRRARRHTKEENRLRGGTRKVAVGLWFARCHVEMGKWCL